MRSWLWASLVVALLAGCSGSNKRENIEPPTELTDFQATLSVQSLWSRSIGNGEERLGTRQRPAISGDRVYAADPEGVLAALDLGSGRALWEVESELRLSGGPGLGDGTLVVGSLDGDVVAFNPDDGSERWRTRVSSEVIATPAVSNGLAVVRANDGRVFAFGITDGERRWVYDRGLPSLTLRGTGAPVIASGVVYLGYDNGQVIALRLDDGVQLWEQVVAVGEGRTEIERMADIDGELAVDGTEVFAAAYRGQVLGIAAEGGRPLWNRELSSYSGIALAGDRLVVADDAGTVWALDRGTGAALWRQEGLAHRWLTTPAVHGSYAVVGDIEGYLHWLRLDDGSFAAREQLGDDPLRATPQVSGDTLVAVSVNGEIGSFRIAP